MRILSLAVSLLVAAFTLIAPQVVMAQASATIANTTPAQATPTRAGPNATSLEQGYVVGVGDVLDVVMVGQDDFRGRVTVQQDGTIQLPLIGSIQAQQKTLLQLGREIAAALEKGGYYVKPAIQVTVGQISSRYVTVLGQVGSPGLIPVDRAYRASEMIARVGGLRTDGAETFFLTRANGQEIPLTMEQIARGGGDADPIVNPGDKIFVPVAPTFYIYGEVKAPGTYTIQKNMTLRMALARSGGLTTLGSDRRITVIRGGQELKKFSLSEPIRADDVIVANERFF